MLVGPIIYARKNVNPREQSEIAIVIDKRFSGSQRVTKYLARGRTIHRAPMPLRFFFFVRRICISLVLSFRNIYAYMIRFEQWNNTIFNQHTFYETVSAIV